MKANACVTFVTTLCLLCCLNDCEAKQLVPAEQTPASQPTAVASSPANDGATKAGMSPLITAEQLKALIAKGTTGVKILEPAKFSVTFTESHLPGAHFLHWVDDITDQAQFEQYNNVKAEPFAKLMSRHGVRNDDRIIIYDRMNSRLSTRLFWTLKYYGHQQVQILDGGYELWKLKSFPLSDDYPAASKSEYKVAAVNKNLLAEMELVKTQLEAPNSRMIDGRLAKQFSGDKLGKVFHTQKHHPRRGHIPGAINIFWADNFNQDGTFKTKQQLRELYANANIKPENDVITYCNEGLHAAPAWFVLTQLLDYHNVRIYDSSMAEWAKTELPMKIDAPAKPSVKE